MDFSMTLCCLAGALVGAAVLLIACVGVCRLPAEEKTRLNRFLNTLDKKLFLCPALFILGYGMLHRNGPLKDLLHRRATGLTPKMTVLFGAPRSADEITYYGECLPAAEITFALLFVPAGLLAAGIFGLAWPGLVVFGIGGVALASIETDVTNKSEQKKSAIADGYPEVLSKLALLTNAGMTVAGAWEKTAYSSDKPIYIEMQYACECIHNGTSYGNAFHNFAKYCGVPELDKLACILSQNITRGGTELSGDLMCMNVDAWAEKKHRVKRKAEKAQSQMMLPMFIMFAGLLAMIIVPIFVNLTQSLK